MSEATAHSADGGIRIHVERLRVEVVKGPDKGLVVISDSAAITIGTKTGCLVTLTDIAISPHHVVILNHDAGYLLRDLGSTNGTWFGIQRIHEALLTPPQRFRIGRSILTVEIEDEDLKIDPTETNDFSGLFGASAAMRTLFAILERHTKGDSDMLLTGELGTGKERVSRALHDHSDRCGPFLTVDCGTGDIPSIRHQLFGDDDGALSVFEKAKNGTVHLTAFGDLPYSLHEPLLTVLSTREITDIRPFTIRVVAAANADLRSLVAVGRFDSGLFYHLANIEVPLPPLRDRQEDFAPIIAELLAPHGRIATTKLISCLQSWRWPGNTGELKSVLNAIAPTGNTLTLDGLYAFTKTPAGDESALWHALETRWARALLKRANNNHARAARLVGMDQPRFTQLLRRLVLL